MKIILIAVVILFVLVKIFKSTKTYHEMALLAVLRKHIDDNDLMQGLVMNNIRRQAAIELLNGKISKDFYKRMFSGGDANTPWWEVNRENIKG